MSNRRLSLPDALSMAGMIFAIFSLVFALQSNELNERMLDLTEKQMSIARKQDSTAEALQEFAKLLGKTDTIMRLSSSQLELNRITQERTNNIYNNNLRGSINRLYAKAEAINNYYLQIVSSPESILENNVDVNKFNYEQMLYLISRLETLESMFTSELENNYLNTNDFLLKPWFNCRRNITSLISFSKDKLIGVQLVDLSGKFVRCEQEMGSVCHLVMNTITNERLKNGYYERLEVGDIVVLRNSFDVRYRIKEVKWPKQCVVEFINKNGEIQETHLQREDIIKTSFKNLTD
jgi:hypothetical protein